MPALQSSRQRASFTDIERQRVRWQNYSLAGQTPQTLVSWFEIEFGRAISTSSIYDILSDKYEYLDITEATAATRKSRGPQWLELEEALFKWWQEIQPREVTGRELKEKASTLWQIIPACQGKKMPSFSAGWLTKWRNRHPLAYSRKALGKQTAVPNRPPGQNKSGDGSIPSNNPALLGITQASPQCGHTTIGALFKDMSISNPPLQTKIQTESPNAESEAHDLGLHRPDLVEPAASLCSPDDNADRVKRQRRLRPQPTQISRLISRDLYSESRRLNAANTPPFKDRKSPSSFDPKLWDDIQELYLHCLTMTSDDNLIPAGMVLGALEPVLRAVETSSNSQMIEAVQEINYWERRRTIQHDLYKKAISIMKTSTIFQFLRPELESPMTILEDWLFDYVCLNSLRSTAFESANSDVGSLMNLGKFDGVDGRRLQHTTSTFSFFMHGGKLDILTRTVKSLKADNFDLCEQFHARVMITPPESPRRFPITVFRLAMKVTQQTNTLSTPIMSFQTTRPASDKIFSIAEHGTSRELQEALSSGEASLADCDPKGRSLINYALRGRNTSALKFLLTRVEDVDTYEVDADFLGQLRPLMAILYSMDYRERTDDMRRRSECLRMLLNSGADPSLHQSTDHNSGSIFYMELPYASVQTVRYLLDEGKPFINANSFASDNEAQCPLIHLANWGVFYSDRIHHNEKIHLLLERGADISIRDERRRSCLHLVFLGVMYRLIAGDREEELKDILMCMVTAGADINAYDDHYCNVSQLVCRTGLERLWIEVLTECGHDVEPFLDYFEHSHPSKYCCDHDACYGAFAITIPKSRPTKLSFKEYSKQRQSLRCVLRAQNPEAYDFDEREELEEDIMGYVDLIDEDSESDTEVQDVYSVEHDRACQDCLDFIDDL